MSYETEYVAATIATLTAGKEALRARLETVETDRAAQAERIRELENRLGCATHNAAVATIGHAQLNEYVAIFDGLGFRGVHVDEQVRRAAAELRALRALSQEGSDANR